jgi:methyl-accepting chemotaxis protein
MEHVTLVTTSYHGTEKVTAAAVATAERGTSVSEVARQDVDYLIIGQSAACQSSRSIDIVHRLATAANEIGEVVGLIQSMASQANLLALDATIEAARVRVSDQGLAVVASEVKSLAVRSSRATEGISNRIEDAQTATDQVVQAVGAIVKTIDRLSGVADVIAAALEEQRAAMSDIAGSATRRAQGTKRVLQDIEALTRTSTNADCATQEVLRSAIELSRHAASFRQEVSGLLANIART